MQSNTLIGRRVCLSDRTFVLPTWLELAQIRRSSRERRFVCFILTRAKVFASQKYSQAGEYKHCIGFFGEESYRRPLCAAVWSYEGLKMNRSTWFWHWNCPIKDCCLEIAHKLNQIKWQQQQVDIVRLLVLPHCWPDDVGWTRKQIECDYQLHTVCVILCCNVPWPLIWFHRQSVH